MLTYTSVGEFLADGGVLAVEMFMDISGMYKLVPGKIDDSYYDNNQLGGFTYITVDIPNPFFKGGYTGG